MSSRQTSVGECPFNPKSPNNQETKAQGTNNGQPPTRTPGEDAKVVETKVVVDEEGGEEEVDHQGKRQTKTRIHIRRRRGARSPMKSSRYPRSTLALTRSISITR
mmetsp:Transcript_24500/g.41950  ORF Transcript_24500/g.41950 Transcript_24500/m.41950 type:complete len:105 (-) Transcript_24500:1132-1446(-)